MFHNWWNEFPADGPLGCFQFFLMQLKTMVQWGFSKQYFCIFLLLFPRNKFWEVESSPQGIWTIFNFDGLQFFTSLLSSKVPLSLIVFTSCFSANPEDYHSVRPYPRQGKSALHHSDSLLRWGHVSVFLFPLKFSLISKFLTIIIKFIKRKFEG